MADPATDQYWTTQPTGIQAGTQDRQIARARYPRRFLYIRNYSSSAQTMWVKFGGPATPGTGGELEVLPGTEYQFGQAELRPVNEAGWFLKPTCPTESIHVITSRGQRPVAWWNFEFSAARLGTHPPLVELVL
jgi:hypothetical protein